jgi:hypothetical protein
MSLLKPVPRESSTQGVGLAAKACARCIAARIQVQGPGWRVPRTAHKHQTGPRSLGTYQESCPLGVLS